MANAALIGTLLLGALLGQPRGASQNFGSPDLTFPVDPHRYEVGPGDVFWLSAVGGLPMQLCDSVSAGGLKLSIAPDGYLVIPLVGALDLEGLTLAEAIDFVKTSFRARFSSTEPLVGLARMRVFRVSVTGNVVRPGLYASTAADRVSDLIEMAGGISHGGAWDSVYLLREGDSLDVDVASYLETGDWNANPMLSAGDVISVPYAGPKVGVEGAVSLRYIYQTGAPLAQADTSWEGSTRGFLSYEEGETASELVKRAGGLSPWAHPSRCYVMRRDTTRRELRLPAPMDDDSVDPVLMPGDMLICPGAPVTVMVSGHVFRPGPQGYVPGMDAGYYIASAGGGDDEADLDDTEIVTPDGEIYSIDELESVPSGSVIRVPRAELVWWQDYLTVLTGVASVVIAWKSIF